MTPASQLPITVRRAAVADAAVVSGLNADVQAIHAAALPWLFKAPGPNTFPPAAAAALLAQPTHLVYLALRGDEPVGYVYAELQQHAETAYRYAYRVLYVHHISVCPAHRHTGVGAALMSAVHRAAAEHGIAMVALDMWSFNDAARAFFRSIGFEAYNERMWWRQ
ncbi:MAG TPA: GNAT family N-acetyltransferase [Gemmatimonadaceae bacterium]|nr:GNAT family N-acetyltransferase [Gemmatimonadaceae bacterium]